MDAPGTHPSNRDLRAYGLGQLDDASAEAVHSHLEGCPDCRRRVAEVSTDSFLGRLRDANARADSLALVTSSVEGRPGLDGGAVVPAPSPPRALPPGLTGHPDYEILRELGRGGMGVVYLARNTLMGRKEILKVVGGDLISHRGVLDRFLREIRSAAKLNHPNVVTAYRGLHLGESLALAMEYVGGLDLSRVVKAKGALPVANACSYMHQAALGLQHAHEHGMVHRDIKPSNLMLTDLGGRPLIKVLDFGLAKVTSEGQVDTSLTREGQMLGTPDYIAPEQIRDAQSADIRADIYSLGCTLYYLLSGRPPFAGNTLWDLYQAHFSMDASPLDLVRRDVPAELAALLSKMMAKAPEHRFQTPGEVARALAPFFKTGSGGAAGPKPQTSPSVRRGAGRARPGVAQVPAQPGTDRALEPPPLTGHLAHPMPARPDVEGSPAPPRPPGHPARPEDPGTIPVGPIDRRETKPRSQGRPHALRPSIARGTYRRALQGGAAAIGTLRRSGPRVWWAATAVLLLGFAAIWATRPTRTPGPPMAPSITNTIGMRFELIRAGDFEMGSPRGDVMAFGGEPSPHRERIARPFYLGINEVTRGQFRRFIEETRYSTDAENGRGGLGWDEKARSQAQGPRYTWRDPGFPQTDDHPVVNVSWNDAVAFAGWLSGKEDRTYRLPTEAEWEYACRAGTTSRYSFGDDPEGLAAVGNIWDGTAKEKGPDLPGIAARDGHVYTAPVGRFKPNGFGLYDMHGNVWEWCSNEYNQEEYPLISAENDPRAAFEPSGRAVRGGSWYDGARRCRSAACLKPRRIDRSFNIGFRLVLVPSGR